MESMSIVSGCVTNVEMSKKSDSKNDQRESMVGVASPADVSPNTPMAEVI
jgi:hypothetical protein